jgi:hypothetical protein
MHRRLTLVLALVAAILVQGCGGLSLGDLDQYVVTWKVSVINEGSDPAAITLAVADKVQTQTVKPGGSFYITSFKGGPWHVTIADATKRRAFLFQRYLELSPRLTFAVFSHEDPVKLQADINAVLAASEQTEPLAAVGGGECAGSLPDPSGDSLDIQASQGNLGGWVCR